MDAPTPKLYVITRWDLNHGVQLAQAVHAAIEFMEEWPCSGEEWHNASNTVVIGAVSTEDELNQLAIKCVEKDIPCTIFREPDMSNAATAVALLPGSKGMSIVRDIALVK